MSARPQTKDKPAKATFQWDDPFSLDEQLTEDERMIRDTARAGGSVVFNGFPGNSMKAFQEGILKVVDNRADYGSIGIDPRSFRAFHVSAVPAVVVVTSDFDLCAGLECTPQPPPFDRTRGNVTLASALAPLAPGDAPRA
ncbi:hypothetical protein OY671_008445, partial [Metschnikowia pulcherrima]